MDNIDIKALDGEGEYCYEDGGKLISKFWKEGSIFGEAKEYDDNGSIAFCGVYEDSIRHGKGEMFFPEGSSLKGTWNEGTLSCDNAEYIYPDGTSLVGVWEDGSMKYARFKNKNGSIEEEKVEYGEDIADDTIISNNPTLQDPYEKQYSYVDKSTIDGAGEGLFAKIDLKPNIICSLYNGIRLTHDIVDNRDWKENSNTISIDEDTVIDVPKEYNDTKIYCSTIGHKANHSFTPNAKYDTYFHHPIFGKIKCIRTLKDITKGQEILVDYGYTDEIPEWYETLMKARTNSCKNEEPPTKKRKLE